MIAKIVLSILFWLAQKVAERLIIPAGKWIAKKYRTWRDKHRKTTSKEDTDMAVTGHDGNGTHHGGVEKPKPTKPGK